MFRSDFNIFLWLMEVSAPITEGTYASYAWCMMQFSLGFIEWIPRSTQKVLKLFLNFKRIIINIICVYDLYPDKQFASTEHSDMGKLFMLISPCYVQYVSFLLLSRLSVMSA